MTATKNMYRFIFVEIAYQSWTTTLKTRLFDDWLENRLCIKMIEKKFCIPIKNFFPSGYVFFCGFLLYGKEREREMEKSRSRADLQIRLRAMSRPGSIGWYICLYSKVTIPTKKKKK